MWLDPGISLGTYLWKESYGIYKQAEDCIPSEAERQALSINVCAVCWKYNGIFFGEIWGEMGKNAISPLCPVVSIITIIIGMLVFLAV